MVYTTELSPASRRGLVSSRTVAGTTMGFILGSRGGTAPLVSAWLIERLQQPLAPASYIMLYGEIGLAVIWPMQETNTRGLGE